MRTRLLQRYGATESGAVLKVRLDDKDGFFKTTDIARREEMYFFIVGRASLDKIKSGGNKPSALDIGRKLLVLPYIAEAMVVGVAD